MTIAVWDGKLLSVDSKRTTYRTNRKTGARTRKGENLEIDKITIFGQMGPGSQDERRVRFRGQVILASARCGSVKTTQMMLNALEHGLDLEVYLRTILDLEEVADKYRRGSVFLVTDKSSWIIRFSTDLGISVKEIGDKKFAMGANAVIARFLMLHLKIDAMHAAAAVTLTSRKCGGIINTIRRDGQGRPYAVRADQMETDDRKNIRMLLENFIAMEVMGKNERREKRLKMKKKLVKTIKTA